MHKIILLAKGGKLKAITALDKIQNTLTEMCSAATLDLTLDFTLWSEYTNLAIYNANYMSTRIYQNKRRLESIPDLTFFNSAKNVVIIGSPKVFSSGLAFEPEYFQDTQSSHLMFIIRMESFVYPIYRFLMLTHQLMQNGNKCRNDSTDLPDENALMLLYFVQKEDGYWSKPYFDLVIFDMNLNNTDINHRDLDDDDGSVDMFLNVFRGTHKCLSDTKVNGSFFISEGTQSNSQSKSHELTTYARPINYNFKSNKRFPNIPLLENV
ncbi:GPR158 [Mytilus coruscus]|uniref:GPR158 n=1 Tax=Mytilus coruscus TaxID=42192 RepID=A0A6J8E2N4_MYTCO|nr:GPR158 [Mytilus coruscus]